MVTTEAQKRERSQKRINKHINGFFRYVPDSHDLGFYQQRNRESFADCGYPEEDNEDIRRAKEE